MTSSEIELRPTGRQLATTVHRPTDDWPEEALGLAEDLAAHYPAGDPFPTVAGAWIARQKTRNTRRTYARQFRVWEEYARSTGAHPLTAGFPIAEAFTRYLETAPTLRPVKGGRRGELAPTGKPRDDASRANLLSACSSFHKYAVRARAAEFDPFALVPRPEVDPDYSDTEGSTEEETARLLAAARAHSPRSYALLLAMYSMALRVDSALGAMVEDLGYDKGHRTLNVRLKGGRRKIKAIPPATGHAIDLYLNGRTTGPLFQTRNGNPLDPANVWKLVRRLATQAGLPHANTIHPHVLKHDAVTHALDDPKAKLHIVQDFADHKDPRTTRRYDRRRNRLASSPGYGITARMAELLDDEDETE
ncbi:MAG: tyrosine-type recombinase/integrase [Streptomyces sp.]|nr:tyrosine-type recombinase/integrase [Streptomyces sp.]NUS11394.1 tyrosine-type recombinase/integrase [Streptomyces sp.]NUS23465.1 tyrosine-type recombinase/integrase [Streptomyces sp.]